MTIALAIASIVVFVALQRAGIAVTGSGVRNAATVRWAAIPYELTHPGTACDAAGRCSRALAAGQPSPWVTALTAMFLHGGIVSLLGDLLFLWLFGSTLEDTLGHVRFLVLYVLAGIAALAVQVGLDPDSTAPIVGAAGPIGGVLAGYLVLYRRARIITLVAVILMGTILAIPAIAFLGVWVVAQGAYAALGLVQPTGGPAAISILASLGGLALGAVAARPLARRIKAVP